MKCIENRLRENIGLDAASVGPGMVQRAVRHRMRSLGLKQPEDYLRFLDRSRAEWEELVESVVVTETWFFRDPEPVAAFARLVREDWLPAQKPSPLRLLSMPCSSGEEPFSLVMALLDAGVPADRFEIEAVDISARALARARQGVYGRNSFRGKDLAFRNRYFQSSPEGFVLDPAVRHRVHFYQGNFLTDTFLTSVGSYDCIFCRNLLIYLDPLTRRKALEKLQRLLAPGALLFVGPVEQPLVVERGFVVADLPMAFARRKSAHSARRPRSRTLPQAAGSVSNPPLQRQFTPGARRSRRLPSPAPSEVSSTNPSLAGALLIPLEGERVPFGAGEGFMGTRREPPIRELPSPGTHLDTARQLADAGRLQEAAEICEAYLRENRTSAQAYYLLGRVRDASGQPGAMDCYRRALYLDPYHIESMLQMAILLQNSGDTARASVFQSRALRVRVKA
jgi:chemotaxis protein methyltransferase WspC